MSVGVVFIIFAICLLIAVPISISSGIVAVLPAVAVLSRLRCPEVHTPGPCNGRVGIARGKLVGRQRAHQGVDQTGVVCGANGGQG